MQPTMSISGTVNMPRKKTHYRQKQSQGPPEQAHQYGKAGG